MIQLLCCPNWPHTLWHLYFCSHCSLCLEGIPTSVSDKNLSVLPNLSASDREPFLIYSKFLWSPLPFNSKALCLCLLSGLWKLLKVEDLSRWSDSPLKFHAKFEGHKGIFLRKDSKSFNSGSKNTTKFTPPSRPKVKNLYARENFRKQNWVKRSKRKDGWERKEKLMKGENI